MTDTLQPATSTDPVVPQTNPELTFDALIAIAKSIAKQAQPLPIENPDTREMIELQEKLHDASVLRSEDAPSLDQVRTIERDPSNPDVLMVYKQDDSVVVVTRELTPEAFDTLDDMAKTLDGIKSSEQDGYERVDDNPFTDADIDGATIGVKDEVGPGLVRAEVFDADGGSRKVIVSKETNAQLYERFVAVDEGRRNDDGKIDVKGKNVVCVLSGGNIDVSFVQSIIEQGMAARHRRIRFAVRLLDRPGSLVTMLSILADSGANILTIEHDKLGAGLNPNEVYVHIAVEVGGKAHAQAVLDELRNHGYAVEVS